MYRLDQPLAVVTGIGEKLAAQLEKKALHRILDLLLWTPLRYEDRSQQKTIAALVPDELVTIKAELVSITNQYRGRRSIQRAVVKDQTGQLKLIWFNLPYLKDSLKKDQQYFFSGRLNQYGQLAQPTFEKVADETVHTNRLVPIYSTVPGIKPGQLRRLLKEIVDHLEPLADPIAPPAKLLPLTDSFRHLHFPATESLTIKARERLAIEELLALMHQSHQLKQRWQQTTQAQRIPASRTVALTPELPFTLTRAQQRAIQQIQQDLDSTTPMNRLLLGDVGSGKTVVAASAAQRVLAAGHHAALIAPTQLLAEQHARTLASLFPDMSQQLLTAKRRFQPLDQSTLYIGTHAVINHLAQIQPAFVIYDEQHRFGVRQRSEVAQLKIQPHLLTMSATPIPRTLMLTIFSHLDLSILNELPAGRKPVKTWVVPEEKRADAYRWIRQQLKKEQGQVFWVCPFIDPSHHQALENIKSTSATFSLLQSAFPEHKLELLHGRLAATTKTRLSQRLFNQEIELLVTTPIVEVGIDLPAASIMVIESAARFGLASLHQLRGRVGRAGQQGYCLLFTQSRSLHTRRRLKLFTTTTDGMKLAELDLHHRGAGDLFGLEQHGFQQLRFANWANLELIATARTLFTSIKNKPAWRPVVMMPTPALAPAAN